MSTKLKVKLLNTVVIEKITRDVKEESTCMIVELIDIVISDFENENTIISVRTKVSSIMKDFPLFAWQI
jgi:glycine hydroxymethyltransferase